jgi:hypothetical protein
MSELRQWEGWQLEESSAEAYERYLVPLLFAPGAEYLIELGGPGPGERVLDVACGTGIVARRAAGGLGRNGRRSRHKRGYARGGAQSLVRHPSSDRVATGRCR